MFSLPKSSQTSTASPCAALNRPAPRFQSSFPTTLFRSRQRLGQLLNRKSDRALDGLMRTPAEELAHAGALSRLHRKQGRRVSALFSLECECLPVRNWVESREVGFQFVTHGVVSVAHPV